MVLGIESSFNDSGASVVRGTGQILSNKIATFTDTQAVSAPLRCMEHHIKHLPLVIEAALEESGHQITEMKAISVTMGPG